MKRNHIFAVFFLVLILLICIFVYENNYKNINKEVGEYDLSINNEENPVDEIREATTTEEKAKITPVSDDKYILRNGDWDEHIREIGNVVIDEKTGEYYLYYSGHTGENVRGKNDVFVGVAVSKDKKSWEKFGKVFDEYAEDPFVINCEGYFWMFYEEKSQIPDVSISLARSRDGKSFDVFLKNIINPKFDSFQSRDTSSPVAVCLENKVVVLYEARENNIQGASLGYAESEDFKNWNQLEKPIFKLPGGKFIVPQDIKKEGENFILTYSDIALFANCIGTEWFTKSLKSNDLKKWTETEDVNGVCGVLMFFDDRFMRRDANGIYTL